jgi:AcrR family transcriptional regulator
MNPVIQPGKTATQGSSAMTQGSMRTVRSAEERINQILDMAQSLFLQKGYDATSVQEIIDAVGIAKGTFYYYFRSKLELLDAMVDRMVRQQIAETESWLADSQLDAVGKLVQIFRRANTWKLQRKEFLLDLLRVMYRPDNAILRERLRHKSIAAVTPLLAQIIQQGVVEGSFDVEDPEEKAAVVLHMGQAFSDAMAQALLTDPRDPELLDRMERKARAYERSVERVLGAPPDSLDLFSTDGLAQWLTSDRSSLQP